MSEELNNIELRSEEVQEILGHIPGRIIRYGITVILSIMLVLFVGSFFFTYPDILTAPVEVVTQNPPAAIVAKVSGNLTDVFVTDSQSVVPQQKLAVIKNPAHMPHVEWLKNKLDQDMVHTHRFTDDWLLQWPDSLVLGDMQTVYASFLKTCSDFTQFRKLNYYPQKAVAMSHKMAELSNYSKIMERQAALKQQDYELAQNQFRRDSGLFVKQVISLADYEKGRQSLLQNRMAVENTLSTVVNTKMQLQDLEQQIADLKSEEIRKIQTFENTIAEQLQNLDNQIKGWFDSYVLISPIAGVVAFNKVWSSNQFAQAGTEVFVILPTVQSEIIGRISLAATGAGKVKTGQQVNLKFDNFPYQEFGMISAQVTAISLIPADQNYMVEVNLPDELITNYGYQVPFTQKMMGTAEIITEDLPLIVRLFNPLKAIFKKHWGGSVLPKVIPIIPDSVELNSNMQDTTTLAAAMPLKIIEVQANIDEPVSKECSLKYYIIAGSFTDLAKAQKEMDKYASENYNCRLLQTDHKVRISIYQTTNKAEALQQLNLLRTQLNNNKLWVYSSPAINND